MLLYCVKTEIGISTKCGCGDTLEETLQNIKQAGFSHVMLDVTKSSDLEESIIITKKAGLNIPYVHLGSRQACELYEKSPHENDFVKDKIREIEICKLHGIYTVVLHPAHTDVPISHAPQKPNLCAIENMNKILAAAKLNGIKVALENTETAYCDHLLYLLDNIDSPYLGLCFDSGHHHLFRCKIDLIEKYRDRIFAVHFHDNMQDWPVHSWTQDLHLLPFDGTIDFDKIAKGIAKSSYTGITMLESYRLTHGEPKPYKNMTPLDFLNKAHHHGKRLADLINRYK